MSGPQAEESTGETLTVNVHTHEKKKTIDEMAMVLPVKQIILELPEDARACGKCGGTYACDRCGKDTGFAHIVATQTPPARMKHSLASPSTVADVMTRKYANVLPLARQEKIWAREGVQLSRATMATWVIQCSQT